MFEEMNDFSIAAFREAGSQNAVLQDLCLRLEVLLVKLQDRYPEESATILLIGQLNARGHHLEQESIPGLDHCFRGLLDERRELEIRSAGNWFRVRIQHRS